MQPWKMHALVIKEPAELLREAHSLYTRPVAQRRQVQDLRGRQSMFIQTTQKQFTRQLDDKDSLADPGNANISSTSSSTFQSLPFGSRGASVLVKKVLRCVAPHSALHQYEKKGQLPNRLSRALSPSITNVR